jgi:hypothetical protein
VPLLVAAPRRLAYERAISLARFRSLSLQLVDPLLIFLITLHPTRSLLLMGALLLSVAPLLANTYRLQLVFSLECG